jgi:hypothetical protein
MQQKRLNIFLIPEVLDIPCLEDLLPSFYRRFGELLSFAQLAHRTCPVEFTLKTLERAIDVFSFFNWDYQHGLQPPFF